MVNLSYKNQLLKEIFIELGLESIHLKEKRQKAAKMIRGLHWFGF
jgi:hypothetical protein